MVGSYACLRAARHREPAKHGHSSARASMKLKDKVAIVTGAGSSLGLAFAQRLAADGAAVVIADIAGAEDAAGGLTNAGHPALGIVTDVSSERDVQAMVDQTVA